MAQPIRTVNRSCRSELENIEFFQFVLFEKIEADLQREGPRYGNNRFIDRMEEKEMRNHDNLNLSLAIDDCQ